MFPRRLKSNAGGCCGQVGKINPSVCGYETGIVDVEIKSQKLAGHTFWHSDPHGSRDVALPVSRE